jgi:hypothetical protein
VSTNSLSGHYLAQPYHFVTDDFAGGLRIRSRRLRAHEEQFRTDIYGRLSPAIRERLDELLGSAESASDPSVLTDITAAAPAALSAAW